jgi:RND family efflux transporter MFP subunit
LLRQLLISVTLLIAAFAGYVLFVPGATETLEGLGITLPAAAATAPEQPSPGAPRTGGPQGPGAGGSRGGFGAREMVVVTAPAVEATINDRLSAIGEGAAAHSVTVMSPATGTLAELLVQPGEVVEAGAVIGRMDDDAERIAFERAKLALEDAEATLARTEELAKASAATTVQINTARLAASNARLEFENAELQLSRRSITSPIAGTVGLFQVSPGNSVSAQSVVTTIEDTSHIVVSFWIPERYASAVVAGMPVKTTAVALPGQTLAGTVSAVDNRIDPASRTLQVRARVPNDSGQLRPGMSFAVTMDFPGEDFPAVDPLAIQWSAEGAYVWRYAEAVVARLPVEIIQRNSDGVLVKGDLQPGEQVVIQGVQQLSPGARVRLLDELYAAGGTGAGS